MRPLAPPFPDETREESPFGRLFMMPLRPAPGKDQQKARLGRSRAGWEQQGRLTAMGAGRGGLLINRGQ